MALPSLTDPARPGAWREWRQALLLALAAAGIVLVIFTPRVVVWRGLGIPDAEVFPEVNRAGDALRQLREPFAPIANPSNQAIAWRLLFPLLGHSLHLPDRIYLGLPGLGCLLVLAYAAGRLRARGWRWDETLAALLLVGAGPWFFVSTGWLAYFDSWLALAVLLCVFSPSRAVLAATVLWAPWVDERFLFVLPMSLLLRGALTTAGGKSRPRQEWWRDGAAVVAALAPFLLVRTGAMIAGRSRDAAALLDIVAARQARLEWGGYVGGMWEGLRFGWVAVVGWLAGWRAGRTRLMLAVGVTAAVAMAAMFGLADDFSRSAATLMPLALVALLIRWTLADRSRRVLVWGLAGLNLAAPAAHVVKDTRVELHALPREWASWRNPPEILRADRYNVRATLLLVEGRAAEALVPLAHALQLEREYQPAHLNRSTALAKLGRGPEALIAAEEGFILDDRQPRAWYVRAVARRLTGDRRRALADAEQALARAGPDDPLRLQARTLVESLRGEF